MQYLIKANDKILHITPALNDPKIINAVLINARRPIRVNNMSSYFLCNKVIILPVSLRLNSSILHSFIIIRSFILSNRYVSIIFGMLTKEFYSSLFKGRRLNLIYLKQFQNCQHLENRSKIYIVQFLEIQFYENDTRKLKVK